MNRLSTQHHGRTVGFGRRMAATTLLAAGILGLAGCAALEPQKPEEAVAKRAQARWDALVKEDFTAAYQYLSPGSKAVTSEKDFVARLRRGFWKKATLEGVKCASPEACEASFNIEYDFQGRRWKTPLSESWVREGSEWWYLSK